MTLAPVMVNVSTSWEHGRSNRPDLFMFFLFSQPGVVCHRWHIWTITILIRKISRVLPWNVHFSVVRVPLILLSLTGHEQASHLTSTTFSGINTCEPSVHSIICNRLPWINTKISSVKYVSYVIFEVVIEPFWAKICLLKTVKTYSNIKRNWCLLKQDVAHQLSNMYFFSCEIGKWSTNTNAANPFKWISPTNGKPKLVALCPWERPITPFVPDNWSVHWFYSLDYSSEVGVVKGCGETWCQLFSLAHKVFVPCTFLI